MSTGQVGKKLINCVDRCVDESLEGFVRCHAGVQVLDSHRVVVRSDISEVISEGKVTLVSGGGSGHEPAHAGYVGKGMLSAVVAGSVFTSPPPADILAAIRTVGSRAGTLLIVKNYTGDRLNFGLAAERAQNEGYKVGMVIVDEDCALASADKTAGRRGLCGTVIAHKLAGAMAEQGKPLEEIVTSLKESIRQMGTIGLSLTPCSVPGSGPSFSLAADEMELGLGIHGEAGVKRMKLTSAKEAVQIMINHMTNPANQTSLKLKSGDEVACMVNNLGGTSVLEMNILAMESYSYLDTKGVSVTQLYNGTFMSSLEMAGFSITILVLNDFLKQCLDSPTRAPGWVLPHNPIGATHKQSPVVQNKGDQSTVEVQLSKDQQSDLYQAVKGACVILIASELELNALDKQSGDGDCGSTLRRGAQAILEVLGTSGDPPPLMSNAANLFVVLAETVEKTMGGSSGALYSLFLTAASRSLTSGVSTQSFSSAIAEGIKAIQTYGGARKGDRTLLDALIPAADKLAALAGGESQSSAEILSQMAEAAEAGAKTTVGMRAQAGRASYVSGDHLTQADPGASGVAIILRAASDTLKNRK
ncbi:triokinase/FMN cyclase-like [Liolophura sinensis]|uniref:triokinase/FMN cyclase-like n=1 Tax=Liolophura sinensis TaxID=3198878 RepID=UPI0031595705